MIDSETAKHHGVCPVCEGYGGSGGKCRGCHDGQDFPAKLLAKLDDGEPCGSWLAYQVVQRHEHEKRQVEQGQGQLLGGNGL